MKKRLYLLDVAALFYGNVFAQETPFKRTEEYCDVTMKEKLFDKKVYLRVDLGQAKESADEVIKDVNGKDLAFNSEVDALNYMNGQGWELFNVYVLREDRIDYRHFIMKRKVSN